MLIQFRGLPRASSLKVVQCQQRNLPILRDNWKTSECKLVLFSNSSRVRAFDFTEIDDLEQLNDRRRALSLH